MPNSPSPIPVFPSFILKDRTISLNTQRHILYQRTHSWSCLDWLFYSFLCEQIMLSSKCEPDCPKHDSVILTSISHPMTIHQYILWFYKLFCLKNFWEHVFIYLIFLRYSIYQIEWKSFLHFLIYGACKETSPRTNTLKHNIYTMTLIYAQRYSQRYYTTQFHLLYLPIIHSQCQLALCTYLNINFTISWTSAPLSDITSYISFTNKY